MICDPSFHLKLVNTKVENYIHFAKLKILFQARGGVKMFGGCIADRVVFNEEEIALANMRGFANVQFSPNSVCRYLQHELSLDLKSIIC